MTSHMGSHVGPPTWDSHVGSPTDGRTDGRTYEESLSPTIDNPSSSVTRTPSNEIVMCPICSQAKNYLYHSRVRVYCSRACRDEANRKVDAPVDEMAVVRLLEGWRVASNRPERVEAVRVLTAQGRSIAWIADHLRTSTRSVERYRHEIQTRKAA